ncbi:TetR family transcriptional regulator [Microtetraspora sp. NBRC 13810]|uniref:TetR/AcrR family transcriptional regulator n=1 Tax=Microtetraspora sp. NBRC 13810 TaxID=3030990 RepID=UPI0024A39C19|nr:TetR/AcrR family transcriptional regulator [Microtetraspora sp. NBRC 13810]GLW12583.1 TetR family transcriptional regulator [Microtetraspora sp. NBRC 13810]
MGGTSEAAGPGGPAGARPARRRLSVDRRREELMAAALELFSRHDAEEVSIDDVASAAGASRALVYHYFGGKQELYAAALRSAAARLEETLCLRDGGRPLDELAGGLRRYFDFVEEHATGFAALLRGGQAGEVGEIVDGVRRRLYQLVSRQICAAEPGALLRITLRSWIASVETAALDWLEHRDVERAVVERVLVDQMVALLEIAAGHDREAARVLKSLTLEQVVAPPVGDMEAHG